MFDWTSEKRFISGNKHIEYALCLYWGWQYVLFWSGLFQPTSSAGDSSTLLLSNVWTMSLVPFALGVLLVILVTPYRRAVTTSSKVWMFEAALLAVAIVLLTVNRVYAELMLPASLLVGLGTGAFTAGFGWFLSRYRPGQVLGLMAVATAAGAVFSLFVSSLAFPLACAVMIVAPFATAYCYATALKRFCPVVGAAGVDGGVAGSGAVSVKTAGGEMRDGAVDAATGSSGGVGRNLGLNQTTYVLFLIVTAVMGVSIALVRCSLGADVSAQNNVYIFNGVVFLGGMLLCVSRIASPSGFSATFFAVLSITVSGIAALSLLVQDTSFSFAVHTLSFTYFNGLFWMLATGFSLRARDRAKAFALTQFTMQVGLIAGTVAGSIPALALGPASYGGHAALVASYAVLLLSVVMLSKLRVTAAKPSPLDSETLRASCASIEARYGLTKRESEILECLCQGMGRSEISAALSVSDETVKTHVSHIYAKLGLHSRQELTDMIYQHAAERQTDILG